MKKGPSLLAPPLYDAKHFIIAKNSDIYFSFLNLLISVQHTFKLAYTRGLHICDSWALKKNCENWNKYEINSKI